MSLKTKLIPVLASLGATATMVPCLTSCGGLNLETHNMLNNTYYNHVLPCLPKTIYAKPDLELIADSYMNEAKIYSDILKDDFLYTCSTIIPSTKTLETFPYEFSKYYLYVQNFNFEKVQIEAAGEEWKVNFSIIIDMAGKMKQGRTDYFEYKGKQISEFDLKYIVYFDDGFIFNASDVETKAKKNKKFIIDLPEAMPNEGGIATSIALGYIKAPNEAQEQIIDDNERIDISTLVIDGTHKDPTSLVLYRDFFKGVIAPDAPGFPIDSHYYYYVNYVIKGE